MLNKVLSKKQILTMFMVLATVLVMAIPAFANTSNWSWVGSTGGNIVNGKANGVFHNMTAGNLTFSGSLWATIVPASPTSPSQWTYQVKKDNGLWPDSTICTYFPVVTDGILGHSTSFSTGCGTIVAGSDYYLYVERAWGDNDGRAYSSSGSLQT